MSTLSFLLIVGGVCLILWGNSYRKDGGSGRQMGLFWRRLSPKGARLYAVGMLVAIIGVWLRASGR